MDFLHQIKLSFQFYWKAFRFIDANNLWKMLVVPAIINLILSFLIIVFAIRTSRFVVEFVLINFQITTTDRALQSFILGLLTVAIRACVFFLYLKVYKYIALIALAPSFAIISSKINTIDSGHPRSSNTKKYLLDCTRGIKIAVRNFFIEVVISTLIIAISLVIAWVIPLAPVAILLLESYFMGYAMADYRNEYFGLKSKESRKLISNYSGLTIGNGLIYNFFILIPLLGVLFAPAFALVASGLSFNYVEKRKSILCNSDQSTLSMVKS